MLNNELYELNIKCILENGEIIPYMGFISNLVKGVNIRLKMPTVNDFGECEQIDTNYNIYVGESKSIIELLTHGIKLSPRTLNYLKEKQIISFLLKDSSKDNETFKETDFLFMTNEDKKCDNHEDLKKHIDYIEEVYYESYKKSIKISNR